VPSGGTGEERADDDVTEFEGRNQQLDYHRVFGGQLLGQFLRIACLCRPDKAAKSLHAVFARDGRADEPIRYQATRHHEGRSFARATITARQSRGVVATSTICMHTAEDGPEHQSVDEVSNGTAFTSAVTSHTIWFHRPFRTDGWPLLRQHSPLLAHGRSFGRGDMLAEAAHSSPPTPKKPYCDSRAEVVYASKPVVSQTH
jgi:acyl-CoA thioesterase